jgi:UMF1 family MFS transporter
MSDVSPTMPGTHNQDAPVRIPPPQAEERVPARQVRAWVAYDWGTQPFNTIIVTFVFTALYLTSNSFLDPAIAALPDTDPVKEHAVAGLTSNLGMWVTIAGILIALLAPVLGQHADVTGSRKKWLGGSTILLVACMAAMYFVHAKPEYFILGAILVAVGSVLSEVSGVNYNAMLVQVSTPSTVGRVSGMGWGLGYLGGILALVIVVVLKALDWFGMDTSDGMAFRLIAVGCAVWAVIFAWPIFVWVPEAPPTAGRPKAGFFGSYVVLWHDVAAMYRRARTAFWFLVSSAVYRDGLAGIFTFGAIVASKSFGFSDNQVVIFGIAASLVAGVCTVLVGRYDDRLGARRVILASLSLLVIAGVVVVAFHGAGAIVFWVGGLALTATVGPAQSASRSFLARMAPRGLESETFGLYAFTGRAASFLAPAMWTLFIRITGATIWGTLGVLLVVLAGLVLFVVTTSANRRGTRPVGELA